VRGRDTRPRSAARECSGRSAWRPAIVVLVLVALCAGLLAGGVLPDPPRPAPAPRPAPPPPGAGQPAVAPPDGGLEEAARARAAAAPALFADFRPLDREALAGGAAPERPRLRVLRPAAVSLDDRPSIRWTPLEGATRYEVRLLDEDGRELRRMDAGADGLEPYTALARGRRYVVEVVGWAGSARVPLALRRSFVVASAEEAFRFQDLRAGVEAHAPEALRPLLVAHLALRAGFLVEAEEAAAASVAARPEDLLARETLSHVRRRLGE
jgi:hypothetical protein